MDAKIHAIVRHCRRCDGEIQPPRRKYCSAKCAHLAANDAYRAHHPERKRAQALAWRNRNLEKARAYYYQNADKQKAAARAWAEQNKDRRKIYIAEHYAKNRSYYLANAKLRKRAVERATPPWLNASHRAEIVAIYSLAATLGYHVDHVVPLQGKTVCGLHVPWNLEPLPARANREKSNKHAA